MTARDDQDERIEAILGDDDKDFGECVEVFFGHLKASLTLPCEVTGVEDFRWEEPYVMGLWDEKEYDRLRKTQPSYQDHYELLALEEDNCSEWMLFCGEDIAAHVRRISDGKEFVLGLAELKATDRTSKTRQLIEDYGCWFANSR